MISSLWIVLLTSFFAPLQGQSGATVEDLRDRARRATDAGRHEDAAKIAARAIELQPDSVRLHMLLGEIYFRSGRFADSVAEFDRCAALDPDSAPHLWQRGISHYYAGMVREGREQFELHRTVNGDDVENSAWHFLCTAKELGVEEARRRFLKIKPHGESFPDRRVPMEQVYELFAGDGTSEAVLEAAEAGELAAERRRLARFYAHLYLGLYQEACGKDDRALPHFRKAAVAYGNNGYMGHVGRVHHAGRMQADDGAAANPDVTLHHKPSPLAENAVTASWPGLFGPQRDSHSSETRLRKVWPQADGPPLVWEMNRGQGYVSPVFQGDRLVYAHRDADETVVERLHPETGARYWSFRQPTGFKAQYSSDHGPRATPVISGNRVFVQHVEGGLHCFDLGSGEIAWHRDLAEEMQMPVGFFGVVTTPLAYRDTLIVNVGAPGGPCVVALDQETGETVWEAGKQWGPSCASPVVADIHGKPKALVFAAGKSRPATGGLVVLDPDSGAIDFEFPFRSRTYLSVSAATPVAAGNRIFLSSSYDLGSVCLDLKPDGTHEVAWLHKDLGLQFQNVVHDAGVLYTFDGSNQYNQYLVALDVATGKELWRTDPRDLDGPRMGQASLLKADGDYLALGEFGDLLWLALDKTGAKILAQASLFKADGTWTPPVVYRGLLYVCQNVAEKGPEAQGRRLLCYDLRQQ